MVSFTINIAIVAVSSIEELPACLGTMQAYMNHVTTPPARSNSVATLLLSQLSSHRDFVSPRLFFFGSAHALAPLVIASAPQGSLRGLPTDFYVYFSFLQYLKYIAISKMLFNFAFTVYVFNIVFFNLIIQFTCIDY